MYFKHHGITVFNHTVQLIKFICRRLVLKIFLGLRLVDRCLQQSFVGATKWANDIKGVSVKVSKPVWLERQHFLLATFINSY